jgi:glycosyltransferase involved in cell wall biosynthesis
MRDLARPSRPERPAHAPETAIPWHQPSRVPALSAPDLSVVMPVFNEAAHLPATIDALAAAVGRSGWSAELVVVDDGSTDGSGDVALRAAKGRLPARVLHQSNAGRLVARRHGVREARAGMVLLLDGRVRVEPDALRFVRSRVDAGDRLWTGHVHVDSDSPLGAFWSLIAELAWRDYFDDPRTTSFGIDEFDRFPKGTTCFLGEQSLLVEALNTFRTGYADERHANDDTPVLRYLAAREDINVSPHFACRYSPRESFASFFRHSIHRGVVFLDGHGTPASRFFPAAVAFYPISAGLLVMSWRRPRLLPAAVGACSVGAALLGLEARRSRREVRALALVTPVYALGHALGMWWGLALRVRKRGARFTRSVP